MRKVLMTTTAVCGLLLAAGASAAPVPFDLGAGPLGDLGSSFTWNASGIALTATAFGAGSPDLWAENLGPDERGLGETLSPDGDNEITSTNGRIVQFSASGGSLTSLTLNSTLPQDTGEIFGSNTPGSLGTLLGTSDSHASFALPPGYLFYDVTALPLAQQPIGSNDTVLVGSVSAIPVAAVPEPASAGMLATGCVGLWWFGWRRRRSL